MSEYITLIGAEQVQSAGASMRGAAEMMLRAGDNISGAIDRFERLVERFEAAAQNLAEAGGAT